MAPTRQITAIANKQLELRDQLWPDRRNLLWNRKENKGFATIPKTLPLILNIMDDMTKGAPVSSTYLGLWCSTWDNSYVAVTRPVEMSIIAGFGGQRGEHTWAGRMKKLQELHFIDIKAGKSGPMSHVIIWNPHLILRYHHDVAKTPGMTEASFTGLIERAMEIGAADMMKTLEGMPVSAEGPIPLLAAANRELAKAAELAAAAAAAAAATSPAATAFVVPPMPGTVPLPPPAATPVATPAPPAPPVVANEPEQAATPVADQDPLAAPGS